MNFFALEGDLSMWGLKRLSSIKVTTQRRVESITECLIYTENALWCKVTIWHKEHCLNHRLHFTASAHETSDCRFFFVCASKQWERENLSGLMAVGCVHTWQDDWIWAYHPDHKPEHIRFDAAVPDQDDKPRSIDLFTDAHHFVPISSQWGWILNEHEIEHEIVVMSYWWRIVTSSTRNMEHQIWNSSQPVCGWN